MINGFPNRPIPTSADRQVARSPALVYVSLWLPVAIYVALIFYASSLSSPPLPESVSDKTLHLAAYGGLAIVLLRALAGGRWSGVTLTSMTAAFLLTTLYGATDEWHQTWTRGRSPEIADVLADASGALLGTVAAGACSIITRLWPSRISS